MSWRKERLSLKERIEAVIKDVASRAQKDREGNPITSTVNRALRRDGTSGQPASRKYSEVMKVPKDRR